MKLNYTASGVLNDAILYLEKISTDHYKQEIDVLSGATIGQHTRHFIEFYQCLIRQADTPEEIINYAKRSRDSQIESDPGHAISCIRDIQSKLKTLESGEPRQLECSEHLPGDESLRISTNLERELMYNIEHTIHHLAIIKIGIRLLSPEIRLPQHFGVAPSTISYRNENACAQ